MSIVSDAVAPECITQLFRLDEKLSCLKNEDNLLPLRKDFRSVAVIGPLADDHSAPLGTWSELGRAEDVVSVLDGIHQMVSAETEIHYVKGCGSSARYFEQQSEKTQNISEAVEAALKSDITIIVVGEITEESGEASSRAEITLSQMQMDLMEAVYATGKPVVAVLMNGRPLAIPWISDHIPAILEIWHPGIQGDLALADILFGDYNQGGKLPVTFPRKSGHCPIYYNHKSTGRPHGSHQIYAVDYYDSPSTPLFPFGYGLSYTTFKYSNFKVDPAVTGLYGTINISVDVTNTGSRFGDEIVQLYLCDVVSSITRPIKELKGFERISLKIGETRTVNFVLGPREIEYFDNSGKHVIEPGQFKVWVGGDSVSGLEGEFYLTNKSDMARSKNGNDTCFNTGYIGGVEK